ncbi:MAG: cytochrome c [Bacteroidota bacterium]|nr:cytochrome c [Bacteroidota bacterium]
MSNNNYLSHSHTLKVDSIVYFANTATTGMEIIGEYLTDREIADVLTYIRGSWGNTASAVTAKKVSALRAKIKPLTPQ